jgi:copper chaperone
MEIKTYHVKGMTCGGCVASLTRALKRALPSLEIEVELERGVVRIEGAHDAARVEQAVAAAGFDYVGPAQLATRERGGSA